MTQRPGRPRATSTRPATEQAPSSSAARMGVMNTCNEWTSPRDSRRRARPLPGFQTLLLPEGQGLALRVESHPAMRLASLYHSRATSLHPYRLERGNPPRAERGEPSREDRARREHPDGQRNGRDIEQSHAEELGLEPPGGGQPPRQ